VERINQFPFYELGKALRAIAGYTGDISPTVPLWDLFTANKAINDLLAGKPIPIGVTRSAAATLVREIDVLWREHYSGPPKPDGTTDFRFPSETDAPIPAWRWNTLRSALSTFETIFAAEMGEAATYFVPRRGIYFTPALIDDADQSFPPDIAGHIPDKAKADWRSAGRCLAFSLLSATGFHVARAVEATLEVYYQLYTAKTGTLNGWNDYIQALETVSKSGATPAPAAKTLAELRQMKDDYRNPVMHPRVTLTENDARMLFDNGDSLIIAMAEEIKAIRDAGGGSQGVLAVVAGTQAALPSP
jgi:hypothetical protein